VKSIYICAGIYAEGPSDYAFLCPLLDRLLDALGAAHFPGSYEVAATVGIDAPHGTPGGRAEHIAAAIDVSWGACTLFVIHADADGDPARARLDRIDPGIAAARALRPDPPAAIATCIPVREIEAWMLADPAAFRTLLGESATPECPADPERENDPKAALRRILLEGGMKRRAERLHAFFGERVRLDALRALPAFRAFECELVAALQALADAHPAR
jgi:hypothetical protein